MKKYIILLIILLLNILTANEISFWSISNMFASNDKQPDLGVNLILQKQWENISPDIFIDGAINLPFINNNAVRFSADFLFQYYAFLNNAQIFYGLYDYSDFYMIDYMDNIVTSPGIFIDYRKQFNDYILIKTGNDLFLDIYPYREEINKIMIENNIALLLYSYINVSFHINLLGGYMQFINLNTLGKKIGIKPLISYGLTNQIGISLSGHYIFNFSDSLPYYIDDSFINDYYYDSRGIKGGLTLSKLLGKELKINASFDYRQYKETFLIESIYLNSDSTDFNNSNRQDKIISISVKQSFDISENILNFKYYYKQLVSSNPYCSYSEHSFQIGWSF